MFDATLMKTAEATVKQAVTVEPGGAVSRATSLTLGRLNPLSLVNLILTPRAYHSANKGARPQQHAALAQAMGRAYPQDLANTVLRLEGTNLTDDLLWQKERNGPLPWTSRLGGRVWQNPRTSLLGKLWGTLTYGPGAVSANLGRASHYNPATDAAALYGDEPAVTTHELGHAIDFNQQSGPKPGLGGKLTRDGYTALYGAFPVARLWHEAQANIKSRKALETGLKGDPKLLHDTLVRRDKTLPAGYGSYIGSVLDPVVPGASLIGLVGGKALGSGLAAVRERNGPPKADAPKEDPTPKAEKPAAPKAEKPAAPKAEKKPAMAKAATTLTADEGGEDAPAAPGSPMRGWQWKVLQKQQDEAARAWMPRLVRSEATPLTELLASPAKQGLLGGAAGGLAGGGLGLLASQLLPDGAAPALVGGGAGLGALLGSTAAYGHRRRANDMVTDVLRRTPPGATLRDYEAVQKADAAARA